MSTCSAQSLGLAWRLVDKKGRRRVREGGGLGREEGSGRDGVLIGCGRVNMMV